MTDILGGASGNGLFLLRLWEAIGDECYLDGEKWQADEKGFYSPDFMCGASGTGHFFLRLWKPERLRMPLS